MTKAPTRQIYRWIPVWRQTKDCIDGPKEAFMLNELRYNAKRQPTLFDTKDACREWITENFGYIADREDLKGPPHGWRVPYPCRVEIIIKEATRCSINPKKKEPSRSKRSSRSTSMPAKS